LLNFYGRNQEVCSTVFDIFKKATDEEKKEKQNDKTKEKTNNIFGMLLALF